MRRYRLVYGTNWPVRTRWYDVCYIASATPWNRANSTCEPFEFDFLTAIHSAHKYTHVDANADAIARPKHLDRFNFFSVHQHSHLSSAKLIRRSEFHLYFYHRNHSHTLYAWTLFDWLQSWTNMWAAPDPPQICFKKWYAHRSQSTTRLIFHRINSTCI